MGLGEALVEDSGEARLRALGYKQELKRDFNLFTNFAVSFSIISILTGITGSFNIAWENGGPAGLVYGWILVAVMTMTVAIGMAEIVSALPSSGGPYFWSAHLASKRYSPFAAWMTGWFNLLGQVAVTAGIEYSLANQIINMVLLTNGRAFTQPEILGIYAGCLVIHALINSFSGKILAYLNGTSAVWHMVITLLVIIALPAVAPVRQSASFVFQTFYNVEYQQATGTSTGITNNAYLFLMAILMSQFTITGYDACAHMSEETTTADKSAPIAIIMSVGVSALIGFGYILALLFSIQDPTTVERNGYGSGQIMVDAFAARFGSGQGGVVMMGLAGGGMFFCGMASLTSNSRMVWSFSRDQAVPGHQLWSKVHPRTGTPVYAVWFCATIAFILGLPMLDSTVAFEAVVSISVIGLYISYGIPIAIRLINYSEFEPGPFNLGMVGRVISGIAVIWILFITAVFIAPTSYPVTSATLNYAPVAVGIVLVVAVGWWFFPYKGARTWYRGEHHTIEDFTVHQKQLKEQQAAEQGTYPGNDDSARGGHVAEKF